MADAIFQTDPEQLDDTLKKVATKFIDEKIKPEVKKQLEDGIKNIAAQIAERQLAEGLTQQAAPQNLADPEQAQNAIEKFGGEEQEEEPEQNIPEEIPTTAAPVPAQAEGQPKPASAGQAPAEQQAAPETAPTEGGQQPQAPAENAVSEAPTQPPTSTSDGEKTEDAEKTAPAETPAPASAKPETRGEQPQPSTDKQQPSAGEQSPKQSAAPGGEEQAGKPTPAGGKQAGQPAPAAGGEAPTDKKPQKNYEPGPQKVQLERGEKGGLTQNINQLRNRKELKNIDNNIKTAEKDIKNITKKLKKPLKELQKKQREKARMSGTIFLLKIIKAILYILCLLGITLAAVPFVKSAITALKEKQKILENEIKTQKKEIEKDMNSKAQANIKIANLEHQRHNIMNRSLLQSNAKQRKQEQQNDSDVGIA